MYIYGTLDCWILHNEDYYEKLGFYQYSCKCVSVLTNMQQ